MNDTGLNLPDREQKPREKGITILIDNGVPVSFFIDTIESAGVYIDFVKFGWGTSLITRQLDEKIECLQRNDVDFFFGGTLFEKFLSQHKVDNYYDYCKKYNCRYIEISNGTLDISNKKKARYISEFSKEFHVFSEIGHKDSSISNRMDSTEWIDFIYEDLEAGAVKVITEARESGTSGICDKDGDIRCDIFQCILSSGIDVNRLIFEAPNKNLQSYFIKNVGSNVNLANIPFHDPIALETLRLGLRSDTFSFFSLGGTFVARD